MDCLTPSSPLPIMHRRLQCTWPGDPGTLPLFNQKPCSLWGLSSNCGACALPGLPLSDLPAAFELSLTCPVSFTGPHLRHPCHCWCPSPLPGVYVLAVALVLTAQDLWYRSRVSETHRVVPAACSAGGSEAEASTSDMSPGMKRSRREDEKSGQREPPGKRKKPGARAKGAGVQQPARKRKQPLQSEK